MNTFNKKEYDLKYDKEHYKQFKAKVKNEEMNKINNLLKEKNINKVEYIKLSYFLINLEDLKSKVKEITSRYKGSSFDIEYNLKNKTEKALTNGITIIKSEYSILDDLRYLIQIKWNNYFLYSVTINPRHMEIIKNKLELLDTSNLNL